MHASQPNGRGRPVHLAVEEDFLRVWVAQEVVMGDRPAVGAGVVEPEDVAGPDLLDRDVAGQDVFR
ncbi:hypothetical protein D3C83_80990 [compost metagenome]